MRLDKRIIFTALLVLLGIACKTDANGTQAIPKAPSSAATPDQQAIEKILLGYQNALQSSSVQAVLPLYSAHGQLLGDKAPSVVGLRNIEQAYTTGFKVFHLDVKFAIEQIVVSGTMAYARTHSTGTMTMLATGAKTPEANRELFVLQKEAGTWKIAVYMFNHTE